MSYHQKSLEDPRATKRKLTILSNRIKRHLRKNDIPFSQVCLIGTGASGISLAAQMSIVSGFKWGFIRKDTDMFHHGGKEHIPVMKCAEPRYIFVDDFCSSGTTWQYVSSRVMIYAYVFTFQNRNDKLDLPHGMKMFLG